MAQHRAAFTPPPQQPYGEIWPPAPEPLAPLPSERHGPRHGGKAAGPRKRRRVYPWLFLAVQAFYFAWLVLILVTDGPCPAAGLLALHWAAVALLLGIPYGLYRLIRRS